MSHPSRPLGRPATPIVRRRIQSRRSRRASLRRPGPSLTAADFAPRALPGYVRSLAASPTTSRGTTGDQKWGCCPARPTGARSMPIVEPILTVNSHTTHSPLPVPLRHNFEIRADGRAMRYAIMPITGTKTMKTNHSALATPPWSRRRKLSMKHQMTMKTHRTSPAKTRSVQIMFSNG